MKQKNEDGLQKENNSNDAFEEIREAIEETKIGLEKNNHQICPHCGRCPVCGKGSNDYLPWNPCPWYPQYPTISWSYF